MIIVNSECPMKHDAPLNVAANTLLIGFTERQTLRDERVTLSGREALHRRVRAKLDGVPLVLDLWPSSSPASAIASSPRSTRSVRWRLWRRARSATPCVRRCAGARCSIRSTCRAIARWRWPSPPPSSSAYIKSGQGTLGGVIYDPAIYEDLRTIVGDVRRNVILRALGRYVLKHH